MTRAVLLDGPREGIGAGRTCVTKQGEIVERVIGWEKSNAIEMQLVSSPWPVERMQWRTEIHPQAHGTEVAQELSYAPSLGVIGTILNALVMRRTMDRTISSVFASLHPGKGLVEGGVARFFDPEHMGGL